MNEKPYPESTFLNAGMEMKYLYGLQISSSSYQSKQKIRLLRYLRCRSNFHQLMGIPIQYSPDGRLETQYLHRCCNAHVNRIGPTVASAPLLRLNQRQLWFCVERPILWNENFYWLVVNGSNSAHRLIITARIEERIRWWLHQREYLLISLMTQSNREEHHFWIGSTWLMRANSWSIPVPGIRQKIMYQFDHWMLAACKIALDMIFA